MLPPPLNKFLLFAAFFFSWKRSDEAKRRQRLARNKRKRPEIKQIKKNAPEKLVQGKKKDRQSKKNCPLPKNLPVNLPDFGVHIAAMGFTHIQCHHYPFLV